MIAIHNSRSAEYRKPFGAVKLGGAVFLALDIFEADDVSVICRLWVDKKGEQLIKMQPTEMDGFVRFSCSFIPEDAQLVWYSFIIKHDGEVSRLGAKEGRTGGEGVVYYHEPPSFQITVYKERKLPEWYKNGIVYQIFPDRFCRGDDWQQRVEMALKEKRNGPDRELCDDWYKIPHYKKDEKGRVTCWDFYGGTLSGIEKKLSYLKELGVTAIYLNPIFEAASNHRYDTADYNKLDAMLGAEDDFERFAQKAKQHGIRIILDGVFNHTGCDSVYFNRYNNYDSVGAIQSEDSPYRNWFKIKPDGSYDCWWGVDDLPDLEETNTEYRDFIFGKNGVVRRWLKAGASGWRLDVADELPDDFIAGIKEAVTETLGDEGLLLGEVWEDASNKISYGELRRYFLGDELDSAMNYPLRDAVIGFLTGKITADEAAENLYSLYENYPHEAFYGALNLLGSHDRARLLTMLGDAPEESTLTWEQRRDYKLSEEQRNLAKSRLWLAALVQMTMPGVPCVYYGDEAGMEGYSDPYNRAAYPWGKEDSDTAAIYRNALAIRRLLPIFTDGDFKPFSFGKDVFGLVRKTADKTAVVMINRSSAFQQVEIPAFSNRCSELVSGIEVVIEGEKAKLALPSFGSAVVYFDLCSGLAKPIEKGAGIICHITSLPNDGKPGCFGKPAKKFIDFLSEAGVKYWQILPLNPTDSYGSPYAGLSAFAGNTDLIATDGKSLEELYKAFKANKSYDDFCSENAFWLESYAAFMALKEKFDGQEHRFWPKQYRSYNSDILKDKAVSDRADFYIFCQYLFFKQWKEICLYAERKGVKIIGDMPIYLSEDSADVWTWPKLFNLNDDGIKAECAGVPPDYFSEEGQHWGNPTYNWDEIKRQNFDWWIERLKHSFEMFDHVRLDHFRAFEAYWSIENGKKAIEGRWIPGPGADLFKAAYDKLGELPIIAEDLGVITTGVRALLAECGFCGMDVIQFYDRDPILGYKPPKGKIVYTGTHDNQTLIGWCKEKYGEQNAEKTAQKLIRSAMLTDADAVILPLQDVFGLDDSARMNVPGVAVGNWKWQADIADFDKHADWLKQLLEETEGADNMQVSFKDALYYSPKTHLIIDWVGMRMDDNFKASIKEKLDAALKAMDELDAGAIANPSEGRMVGHYWLRAPKLAPNAELCKEIEDCVNAVTEFTEKVHSGDIKSPSGKLFKNVVVAGIGGSSLGPVFVANALSSHNDKMKLYFLDNTDPDGMDNVFGKILPELDETLTVVISKSGGTIETRNCMEEVKAFYKNNNLDFAAHMVCITGADSKLDKVAKSEGWLARFPMWDWVGGRTSVMSAVGMLPLCLMGVDMKSLLKGAAECDELNREKVLEQNPAAILAASWYLCSGGIGGESMVVLPYKDSLELFAKYLQQLIMESLGKEFDNEGNTVNQGLAVFGNKGTSDQHSYVQQLVAGPDNIFVTFVQVLRDRVGSSIEVGEGSTSGDYLNAFMLGTKKALESHGKRTMTITVPEVSAYYVGALIALFERTVGIYANLININAYDQPAVEFGKKAAGGLIELKNSAKEVLLNNAGEYMTAAQLAEKLSAEEQDVFRLMLHLSANDNNIKMAEKLPISESGFAYIK